MADEIKPLESGMSNLTLTSPVSKDEGSSEAAKLLQNLKNSHQQKLAELCNVSDLLSAEILEKDIVMVSRNIARLELNILKDGGDDVALTRKEIDICKLELSFLKLAKGDDVALTRKQLDICKLELSLLKLTNGDDVALRQKEIDICKLELSVLELTQGDDVALTRKQLDICKLELPVLKLTKGDDVALAQKQLDICQIELDHIRAQIMSLVFFNAASVQTERVEKVEKFSELSKLRIRRLTLEIAELEKSITEQELKLALAGLKKDLNHEFLKTEFAKFKKRSLNLSRLKLLWKDFLYLEADPNYLSKRSQFKIDLASFEKEFDEEEIRVDLADLRLRFETMNLGKGDADDYPAMPASKNKLITPSNQGSASSFGKGHNPLAGFGYLPAYSTFVPDLRGVLYKDIDLIPDDDYIKAKTAVIGHSFDV